MRQVATIRRPPLGSRASRRSGIGRAMAAAVREAAGVRPTAAITLAEQP